jgi:hypothetical protein
MFKELYHFATFMPRNKKRTKACLKILGDIDDKESLEAMAEQGVSHDLIRNIKSVASRELTPKVEEELLFILKSITVDCKMKDEIEAIEVRLSELNVIQMRR